MKRPYLGRRSGSTPWSLVTIAMLGILCCGWADTWEGIRTRAGQIQSVQADFIQEKHLQILEKPLVSKGVFYFRAPDSLRWEYRMPVESTLLMHQGKVKRFIKTESGVIADAGARLQAMQVVMTQISSWLNGRFRDNPNFEADLIPGPKIVMTPKDPGMAKIIRKIELVLSSQPGIIDSVFLYESDQSYTRLIFSRCRLNTPMDDSLFSEEPE